MAADARLARLADEARREPGAEASTQDQSAPFTEPAQPPASAAPAAPRPTPPPVESGERPLTGEADDLWASLPSAASPRAEARARPQQTQVPGMFPDPRLSAPAPLDAPPTADATPRGRKPKAKRPAQTKAPARQPERAPKPERARKPDRAPKPERAPKPSRSRQPDRAPKPAAAPRSAEASIGGFDLPLLIGAAIFVVGVGILAAWWAIGRSPVPGTSSTVDQVSLNVTQCDGDGATAIVVNAGPEARQFDATVTFASNGDQLYPVVIPLQLEPSAQQTLQIPFTGVLDPAQNLECAGALSNLKATG